MADDPAGAARASTDGVDPTAPSPRKVVPMDESKDEDEDLCESREAPAEDAGPDRVPVSRMTKGGFLVAAVLPLLLDRLRKHVVVACLDGGGAVRTPGDLGCAIARYLATVLDVVARAWATGDAALARVLGARAAAFFAGELRYAACHDAVNKKRRRHARDLRRGDGVEWDGDADGSWFAPGEADDGSPDTLRGDVALSQDERPPKDETTSPAKPPPVDATALRCAAGRAASPRRARGRCPRTRAPRPRARARARAAAGALDEAGDVGVTLGDALVRAGAGGAGAEARRAAPRTSTTTRGSARRSSARRRAARVLRRLCGGSGREYRACRDSHVFARHAAKLVGALRGLGERRELSYGATVALDASLRKLLRLARARSHHWRTFCSRPRLERPGDGANDDEARGGTIVIDGDDDARDDDDAASLADASDDETDGDGFARAPCCAVTLFRLCVRLPRGSARDAALELLERCARRGGRRRGAREDARADAERDGARRAETRHRRRFARFLGYDKPAAAAAPGLSRAACGLVDALGAEARATASPSRTPSSSTATRGLPRAGRGGAAPLLGRAARGARQRARRRRGRARARRSGGRGAELLAVVRLGAAAALDDEAAAPRRRGRTQGARFTESCSIAQLRGVRRIHAIELRLREPRGRYVRRLRVWYVAREVDSIGELAVPANWPKWSVAATARLTRGQTSVKIPLPAPLVAANLLFEYEDFYPQRTTPGGGAPRGGDRGRAGASGSRSGACLHCPRCGRAVTDAHGVCQHCGEVAFQCRQCRHINYERLDAFLCVECGYCAFGDFGYRLRSEAAPDALAIASAEELEAARRRLQDRGGLPRHARRSGGYYRNARGSRAASRAAATGPTTTTRVWRGAAAPGRPSTPRRSRSRRRTLSLGSPAARARRGGFGRAARRRRAVAPVVAALFDRDQVLGCDAEPAAPPTGGGGDRVLTLEGVVPGAPASLGASLARALRGEGPGGRGLAGAAARRRARARRRAAPATSAPLLSLSGGPGDRELAFLLEGRGRGDDDDDDDGGGDDGPPRAVRADDDDDDLRDDDDDDDMDDASLLLLAACGEEPAPGVVNTAGALAGLEFACAALGAVAAGGSASGRGDQLVAAVFELVADEGPRGPSEATRARRAYLRARGFGGFACRLARLEAAKVLDRDDAFATRRRGGVDALASIAVAGDGAPGLLPLADLAIALRAPERPGSPASEGEESAASAAARAARREALHVPLEATLALRELRLLRSVDTEDAAEMLARPAAAAPKWRREDRYAFLAAACDLLRRRRAHRLHALAEEPPPRLSVASVEGLLRDMGDAVCPKKAKARVALQLRRAPTQEEFFRGNLPRSAVDLDDVPASTPCGAGGARRDDDDDGGGREPTMGDVRNKIAKDLDMADAAEMLELVVCDRIVNLDLPVRGVHARLWAPKANAPRRAHRRQLGALAAALGGPSVGDDDDDDDVDDDDDDDMRDDDDGDDGGGGDGDEMDEDDVDDDDDDGDAHPLLDDDDDDELDDDDDEGAAHPAIAAAPRSPGSGDRSPKRRRRAKRQLPPMLVTYRLTGVDGEATEERLETLGGGGAKSDAADKYPATAAIAAADGLVELVRLVATGDEALVPRALSLLRMCAQVEAHARQLAELGAPGALLARLVSALKARSGATEMVEKLLSLLERLAPAAAEASSGGQASQTLSDDDGSHLETLVGGLGDQRRGARADAGAAQGRLPPVAGARLRQEGRGGFAGRARRRLREGFGQLGDVPRRRRAEASCLREAVEGLGGFGDHDALAPGAEDVGDALARVGFAKSLAEALAAALPKRFPKLAWAEKRADVASPADWVAALDAATPTIEACVDGLRGCCLASRACGAAAAARFAACHGLEALQAPKHRGASLKAEALLDAVARSRHGGAAAAVVELRKASSDARSAYALKRRARTLKRLGLEAPEPAAAKAAPAPEEDPELGGPRGASTPSSPSGARWTARGRARRRPRRATTGGTAAATTRRRRGVAAGEPRDGALDAATATRARTYAKSGLTYVALLDKLHALVDVAVPARTSDGGGRVDLHAGDHARVAAAAADLATFYDDDLRDADSPADVLDKLDLGAAGLDLPDDVRTTIFG
ncbi:hypothetical protein JL720_5996 [Aureococcus anophagefferens]|nr:hypothetical protein JL720_5996 [Aureococcus anophagefferens]